MAAAVVACLATSPSQPRCSASPWRAWTSSGWAKMVRMTAATMSWLVRGTMESTFLMKCTRQRCQAAPWKTVLMAFFRPVWASEMTSLTTIQPPGFQGPQELGPKRFVLAIADVEAEDFTASVGGNTDGDDHGLGDDAVVDAGLAIRGVEEHVGVAARAEVTAAEHAHFVVEIRANSGYFGLGDAGVRAEGLDQIIDLAGGDAMEVSLHNDGEQGLVNASATLEQGGEERPLTELGDLQM